MPLLSIIIPAFNEETNIENTTKVLKELMEREKLNYELIFISDGSTDATYEKITLEMMKNSCVKGAEFSRNFGKEASIFAGLELALGEACVVIDCDLQHPPDVIPKMYRLWTEGYQVIEGIKTSRGKESFLHKLFANTFYGIMGKVIKIDMKASSDFKLIDRKVVNALLGLTERNTFFRALTFWAGFSSISVEYEVQERIYGETKWSFWSLMKYAVMNTTSFTTIPLQIVTLMGVLSIGFSIIMGIQTAYNYFKGNAVEGFTTVILLLLIIGGFIMLSLGIIGHYLARIYEEVKGRPKYIIKNLTNNIKENI